MKCPNCGQTNTSVIDSRTTREDREIRRRRACEDCGYRFTTYERPEERVVFIVKKDKRREAFSRDKLLSGLHKACEKLDITSENINNAAMAISRKIFDLNLEEVPSKIVGQFVMEALFELDEVAYIRFASVYLRFQEIQQFISHIDELRKKKRSRGSEKTRVKTSTP
jgi:transcriptional repressor NrdR